VQLVLQPKLSPLLVLQPTLLLPQVQQLPTWHNKLPWLLVPSGTWLVPNWQRQGTMRKVIELWEQQHVDSNVGYNKAVYAASVAAYAVHKAKWYKWPWASTPGCTWCPEVKVEVRTHPSGTRGHGLVYVCLHILS